MHEVLHRFLDAAIGSCSVHDFSMSASESRNASSSDVPEDAPRTEGAQVFRCQAGFVACETSRPLKSVMQQSTVKWFDAKKGYGFINHPRDGDDVFVHYSNIESDDDFKTLRTGQRVKFEMNDGPKGLHALNVEATGETDGKSEDAHSDTTSSTPEIDPSELDPTAEVDPSPTN